MKRLLEIVDKRAPALCRHSVSGGSMHRQRKALQNIRRSSSRKFPPRARLGAGRARVTFTSRIRDRRTVPSKNRRVSALWDLVRGPFKVVEMRAKPDVLVNSNGRCVGLLHIQANGFDPCFLQ